MDHDQQEQIALHRWAVIAEAAGQDLTARERGALVRQIAGRPHAHPDGSPRTYSRQTIDRWLRAWRQGGLDALRPAERSDTGVVRGHPELFAEASALRLELPGRSAAQIASILYHRHGIKVSERRDFWEAGARCLFGTVHLDMRRRDAFSANFEYTSIADLVLCRLASSVPHRVALTDTAARQLGRNFVKAILQIDGCSVLSQNGRTTALRAGEWSVYDFEQPYSVEVPKSAELCILLIPRDKVLTGDFDLGNFALRRFSGRRGLGKLIWSLALATFDQVPEIQDRSSRDVADILVQMIRMALVDSSEGHAWVDSKEALRQRVKLYIARHLADADLSITKLAGVTQCSKRYLHMVFQPEQISISDYILKLRLDRCREDLLNPACAQRSITDIAYSWGFNNSNHFSRCFKQTFGVCPRHMRNAFTAWSADRPEDSLKMPRPQLPAALLLPALPDPKKLP